MNYKKSNVPLYIKEVMKEKGIMSKTLQEALGMAQTSVSYIINNKIKFETSAKFEFCIIKLYLFIIL